MPDRSGADWPQVHVLVVTGLQIAILVRQCMSPHARTGASIPAASLGLVAALSLLLLSPVEHLKTYRPSSLIMAYLFIAILFGATRARSYYLMSNMTDAAIITAQCVAALSLFALESSKKTLEADPRSKAPEDLAGPISSTFFLWLNRLISVGYKRSFTAEDLGIIGIPLYTASVGPRFARIVNGNICRFFLLLPRLRFVLRLIT